MPQQSPSKKGYAPAPLGWGRRFDTTSTRSGRMTTGCGFRPRPGSSCAEAAMIAGLQGSPLVGIAGIDVAVPANLSGGRQFVDLGQGVGKVSV